ncbi:AfsR/SARP family transcriptional regulator [Streptomyces griseoruber]
MVIVTVEFRVLGSVEASVGGRPVALGHARQRAVLAALLVDVNRLVTTDQLTERIWGGRPPRQVRSTLHSYLSRLRQVLTGTGAATITREPGGYVLTTAATATVDLHSFRRLVTQARAADDDTDASALFDRALRLWRAAPFTTLDTPWINDLRATLEQERLSAQLDLGDLLLRLGRHAALLPELSARAEAHPLDERVAGQLMLALHRCGRPADALDHYQRTRRRLTQELGVGPSPALQDIQAAVLRRDTDSVRPPEPPTDPIGIPAQLPPGLTSFTGRGEELAWLDSLLPDTAEADPVPPAAVVVSAVSGTAGVGKTALAVHWAHRVRKVFPDGQLYINLRGFDPGGSVVSPAEAVRAFLDALGVPPTRIPDGLQAQTGLYRSLLADRRVLVLLDNALDAGQVRPLLPGMPGSLALVTSRNRLTSLAATEGARLLPVDLLAPADARHLLAGRLGARRVAAEPAAADEIIARCAGLPLALSIVAARAEALPGTSLAALATELEEADGRLDALDAGDPTAQVRAVFSWSYRLLSADAAHLFRLLGLHPGPEVGLRAAAALADVPAARARTLLAELTGGHLLTEHTAGRYAFHDLLRSYAAELVAAHDSEESRHTAVHRILDHYLHTAHAADALLTRRRDPITLSPAVRGAAPEALTDHQQALAWFTAEHPVLLAVIEWIPTAFAAHAWQLASALNTFLDRQGRWPALAAAHTTALDLARRRDDRTGLANAHRGLGLAEDRQCHAEEARAHYALALDLFGELGNDAGQARIHQNLGRMSSARGDYREALAHAHRTLEHYHAADDRGGQAIALNHLGWYHTKLGDHRQALPYCRQALALIQELGDPNGEAHTWDSLGYIHRHLGQYGQAVDCYRHALELFRVTGDRHSEAIGFAYLGDTHQAAGDPTAARDAWTRALNLFEELGHPDAGPLRAKLNRE